MFKRYWKIIVLLSLPLQILIIELISVNPSWVEKFYTGNFYKYLSQFLRMLLGAIPVPVGQLLFYSWVAALVGALGKQVKMLFLKQVQIKQFIQNILFGTIAFLSAFYFLFTTMWGLNYHRQPIQEIVQINPQEVSRSELEILCRRLIQLTNESRNLITPNKQEPLLLPLSHDEIIAKATMGFEQVSKLYPEMAYTRLSVKQVYVPQVMSYFGVAGIYFPFTGEANVNMDPPAFLLPATVCHEMAHQIGFASEDEANYVAYLACRMNPDPAFQYSGNYMAMKYAMNRLKKVNLKAYKQLQKEHSPGVLLDLEKNRDYWERFQNPMEEFSKVFYDLFLKANDEDEGIKSYSKVVELIMGEFRKNKLIYNLPVNKKLAGK